MKNILVIMAKEPKAGKVKTRLYPALTTRQAAELYRCFLIDKIAAANRLKEEIKEIDLALAFDPSTAQKFFQKLAPPWIKLVPQSGGDLGDRLTNLFDDFFGYGFDQVVIADSDSPTLPLDYLGQSFRLLELADAVLGPSQDGGYYLIGLRKSHPELFQNIAWSTREVLEHTITQAEKHHLKTELLPQWYDVDTPQELQKLQSEIAESTPGQLRWAKTTKNYLRNLRLR